MEKRLFLAVTISIALLAIWAAAVPRLFPELAKKPDAPAVAQNDPQTPAPVTTAATGTPAPGAAPAREPRPEIAAQQPLNESRIITTTIDDPLYTAVFSNSGAQLVSFRLKNYKTEDTPVELIKYRPTPTLPAAFAIFSTDAEFTRHANTSRYTVTDSQDGGIRTLVYRWTGADGKGVVKTFSFPGGYEFNFSVEVIGSTDNYRVAAGPGIHRSSTVQTETQFLMIGNGVLLQADEKETVAREEVSGIEAFEGQTPVVGLEDNYFLIAFKPKTGTGAVFHSVGITRALTGDAVRKDSKASAQKEIYAGVNATQGGVEGSMFLGPKQADVLERHGLEKALDFGWFGFIARMLLRALVWIFTLTKNYGWAIIVLTIIIKSILYPLQHKSIVSMKRMQKVQPKVNALRDKFKKAKTDPEQRNKLNMEMMKLYKQEGVNPMSGCLPLLLQLPILWAFYGLLSHAIELRGAPFIGWITDLSQKDPYYITPILMTITMFIQQWMTPTTVDPAQRKVFLMMPLIFGFIFKDFPSGLVLYWLVQNLLGILQQMIMNRWWKEHPETVK